MSAQHYRLVGLLCLGLLIVAGSMGWCAGFTLGLVSDGAPNAFLAYVEAGGGLLLSNLAFHYLFDMGVDPGEPRYFGANANSPLDWTDIQITQGQEDHPIFDGLPVENGIIQYDIQGWTEGSDFYTPNGPAGPNEGDISCSPSSDTPSRNAGRSSPPNWPCCMRS